MPFGFTEKNEGLHSNMQNQIDVSAYFSCKQLLLFGSTEKSRGLHSKIQNQMDVSA